MPCAVLNQTSHVCRYPSSLPKLWHLAWKWLSSCLRIYASNPYRSTELIIPAISASSSNTGYIISPTVGTQPSFRWEGVGRGLSPRHRLYDVSVVLRVSIHLLFLGLEPQWRRCRTKLPESERFDTNVSEGAERRGELVSNGSQVINSRWRQYDCFSFCSSCMFSGVFLPYHQQYTARWNIQMSTTVVKRMRRNHCK